MRFASPVRTSRETDVAISSYLRPFFFGLGFSHRLRALRRFFTFLIFCAFARQVGGLGGAALVLVAPVTVGNAIGGIAISRVLLGAVSGLGSPGVVNVSSAP